MILRLLKKHRKKLAILTGSLFFCLLLFMASIYGGLWGPLPSKEELRHLRLDNATLILDENGTSIGSLSGKNRIPVTYDALSPTLIDALIATEDVRFYEHDGIDVKSLFRVLIKTVLLQDASSGGGSTLTQQLAKNLFPRTDFGTIGLIAAKVRESIIASRLEALYTKEELLEKYLNTVPFSDNTFGVESASLHFFNKHAKSLAPEESATLIGMLKATHTYNPRLFPERSLQRRNTVLHQMLKYELLTREAFDTLSSKALSLDLNRVQTQNSTALYFKEQVRKELENWALDYEKETGKKIDIYSSGLEVKTTLNLDMQVKAEQAMKKHLSRLQSSLEKEYGANAPWKRSAFTENLIPQIPAYQHMKARGLSEPEISKAIHKKETRRVFSWDENSLKTMSLKDSLVHYLKLVNTGWVSLEPSTGAVKTWIGGIDYRFIQYDHVVQSKRQVGSVFKPIVYATAIEQGVPPCKYYDLRKVEYENLEGWSPGNASDKDKKHYMNYTMEYALSRSVNTVAVKVLEDAGIDPVIRTAGKLGITSELPRVPSLALGTAELSVLEMAKAYTAFVNEGVISEPYMIETIQTADGEMLFDSQTTRPVDQDAAFSAQTARLVLEMLRTTVDEGTGKRIREAYGIQSDLAGKTGTTQNNKDGWFVGLSHDLVSVSWVGFDDQRLGFPSTRTGQGANSALPMFAIWWKALQSDKSYSALTDRTFGETEESILEDLDCEPVKRDHFLKRLFKNPKKTKKRKFKGLSDPVK